MREAVQKLEAEGYIDRVPMKGNRVRSLSPHELAHSFSIRKALETLAVQYSAIRITDGELACLEEILSRADILFASSSGDALLEGFIPLVRRFNSVTFEACRSKRLLEFIWSEREIFDRYRVMRGIIPVRAEKSLERRKELYEAFRRHNPEKARIIWTEHLDESFTIWREQSGYGKELEDFQFI